MAGSEVRYRVREEALEVVGGGRILWDGSGDLLSSWDDLAGVSLASLRRALRRLEHYLGGGEDLLVWISDDPAGELRKNDSPRRETRLVFGNGELRGVADVFSSKEPDLDALVDAIAPVLDDAGAVVAGVGVSGEYRGAWMTSVEVALPKRGVTVREVVDATECVGDAARVFLDGGFTHSSAAALVRGGRADVLVGLYENNWFDAKRVPYRLDEAAEEWELAKDVTAFANAGGGLLLVGAKTKKRPDGEFVSTVNGCRAADLDPSQYLRVLRALVHPTVEGLDIAIAPISGRPEKVVLLLDIPAQEAGLKPFLVGAAVRSGSYHGAAFTYAIRAGDDTEFPTVESVRLELQAGRVHLATQGEEVRHRLAMLEDANAVPWLRSLLEPIRAAGFRVARAQGHVYFTSPGGQTVEVQESNLGEPLDGEVRDNLLRRLGEIGLPVKQNRHGRWILADEPDWQGGS